MVKPTAPAEVKAEAPAEVKAEAPAEVKAELDLDQALANKPRAESKDNDNFRGYVVIKGDAGKVVNAACVKAGVSKNLSGWLKGLMLADLKRRLNGMQ